MKKLIFTLTALSLVSLASAQEFDDFGGGDFGGYEESSTPAVTITGEVGAETRAWIGTTDDDGYYNTRNYDGIYDVSKTELDAGAYANLELNYEGDYTGANLKLKLDSSTLTEHPEDVIDEVSASGSFKDGRIQVKAGKMKEVWGKGDKIHVLDNFNANDYTDFIFPDYIDRRLGEVMFKSTFNLSWDYNLKLEGIFTPWMTADRFASEGSFLYPAAQANLTSTVKDILVQQGSAITSTAVDFNNQTVNGNTLVNAIMGLSDFSTDDLYEDNIRSIKYAQGGLRMTGTLGGLDWGLSYYYGHYKQPSAKLQGLIGMKAYANAAEQAAAAAAQYTAADDTTNAATYAAAAQNYANLATSALAGDVNTLVSLNYDQMQVFGVEAAFVLWKLNTRWEFAYNLTEDIAGDDPWVKNNSISWVGGFDIDIPIHNLNLNVQETGTYTLKSDKIKNGGVTVSGLGRLTWETLRNNYDVDYNSDKKYMNNKLIVLLSDKWLNEKLTTEVQGIYCIETKDFMVAPNIEYNVTEGLTFGCRFAYLYSDNENGEFYNFTADSKHHDKAFLQLTAKYQF